MGKKAAGLILALAVLFSTAYATPVVVDQVATTEKVVALTIEDIDTPSQLEEILALLSRDNGKATFFIPGRAAAGLPLRRAAELGHELGNHSMNHGYWGGVGQAEIARDIADAAAVIQKAGGAWPAVIRPPYDYYGDTFFQATAALAQPVTVIRGTETGDWLNDTAEAMSGAAAAAAKPGAILNINMRFKAAAKALPRIVHQLYADGFQIVTVSELIKRGKATEVPKPAAAAEPPPKSSRRRRSSRPGRSRHLPLSTCLAGSRQARRMWP